MTRFRLLAAALAAPLLALGFAAIAQADTALAQTPPTNEQRHPTRPPVPETMPVWFTSAEGRQVHGVAGTTRYTWRLDRRGAGSISILGPRPMRSDQPQQAMRAFPFRLNAQQMRRVAWLIEQARVTPNQNGLDRICTTDGTHDVVQWRGPRPGSVSTGHCEDHARVLFINEAVAMMRTAAGAPLPGAR